MKTLSNKTTLTSRFLLLKTTEIHASYFLKIFRCLTKKKKKKKKKSPHCYANPRGTLNLYEHFITCLLNLFNLTHSYPNEEVTFKRLVICIVKFIIRSNHFICWSSQFYNINYIVTTMINFHSSTH